MATRAAFDAGGVFHAPEGDGRWEMMFLELPIGGYIEILT
jgi:hypothetical protein